MNPPHRGFIYGSINWTVYFLWRKQGGCYTLGLIHTCKTVPIHRFYLYRFAQRTLGKHVSWVQFIFTELQQKNTQLLHVGKAANSRRDTYKLSGPAVKEGHCVTGGGGSKGRGRAACRGRASALKFISAGDKALTGVYVNDRPTDSSAAWH